MRPLNTLTLSLMMAFSLAVIAQPSGRTTAETIDSLELHLPAWMNAADIPGLQAVLIQKGKVEWIKGFGLANAETKVPVDENTLFEAASLSKVMTAYGALKLVDQGKLNLDKPLNAYLGNNYEIGNDPRIRLITARRVLSHSAGFPNWRAPNAATLPIEFNPGERFSYSGEGFVYLSKVMEKLSGKDFESYMHDAVFVPLAMGNSYFSWQDTFAYRHVFRHDWQGMRSTRWEEKGFNAAASLHTSAGDYAKFMIALLNGTGLKKKTWLEMFTPQIRVDSTAFPELYWGLGVGLEIVGKRKSFWHWGDQGDSKCYMKADLSSKDGFLYFTNSANGLAVADRILEEAMGEFTPALAWLNYERFNPAVKELIRTAIDSGAATALAKYLGNRDKELSQQIPEVSMNGIGYKLLRLNKTDDAILVFEQNTKDYPASANTWDSLAEAYDKKGNKELAIRYYQKSLDLDAGNINAAEQIRRLKQ
ncbi:serine hydrolase [Terrimonas sp. NA20]|uniref:Serine hydrolase n=1 Tax=Terrimonas ginsenosidimutans TaxID=2908004 RepID=A0ABS9KNZ6_9BACT|nr:serine hydrolase domain-containing protein [Terrimonas ginsenosidimutans]MCG2614052.1 serine hydrolase [Terrimonas ginsenosidimutans]